MDKKHNTDYAQNIKIVFLCLSAWIVLIWIVFRLTGYSNLSVKIAFLACNFIALFLFLQYVFDLFKFNHIALCVKQNNSSTLTINIYNRYYLILIAVCLVVYFPFLINGYFYYDDYWNFSGSKANYTLTLLQQMRPFHGLLADLFWFVSPSQGYIIKWFSVACALVYGLLLFKWLKQNSGAGYFSLLLAIILVAASALSDHIGYSATISFLPGMILASLSVIYYDMLYHSFWQANKQRTIFLIAIVIVALIFSFMFYQISTQIVFLFLAIRVYFNREKNFKYVACYSFLFSFSAIIYYVLGKFLIHYFGIVASSRGALIGIGDIQHKTMFFLKQVLPASFDRISAIFGGRLVISDINYWHTLSYHTLLLKYFSYAVILSCILSALVFFLRDRRKLIDAAILIAFVPASYYCFLIIKENGYLTYYAFSLISLLLFYIAIGISSIISTIHNRYAKRGALLKTSILLVLAIIVCIQNNIYISQFWVRTNQESYNHIKHTIATQIKFLNKIHVFGVLTPGQGNIYAMFATNWALRELERNPEDFTITVSENEYFIPIIQDATFKEMSKILSLEELEFLRGFYIRDDTYGRFLWSHGQSDETKMQKLRELFTKCGLLPDDYSDIIVVDLRWVSTTW